MYVCIYIYIYTQLYKGFVHIYIYITYHCGGTTLKASVRYTRKDLIQITVVLIHICLYLYIQNYLLMRGKLVILNWIYLQFVGSINQLKIGGALLYEPCDLTSEMEFKHQENAGRTSMDY